MPSSFMIQGLSPHFFSIPGYLLLHSSHNWCFFTLLVVDLTVLTHSSGGQKSNVFSWAKVKMPTGCISSGQSSRESVFLVFPASESCLHSLAPVLFSHPDS